MIIIDCPIGYAKLKRLGISTNKSIVFLHLKQDKELSHEQEHHNRKYG